MRPGTAVFAVSFIFVEFSASLLKNRLFASPSLLSGSHLFFVIVDAMTGHFWLEASG
jgi:hypothetical protein